MRKVQNRKYESNWLGRNWKWFVPVGCLGYLTFCVGFIALLIHLVFTLGKSSDVYQEAVAKAQDHPSVIELLGKPIEEGWYVTGKINISGPSGKADIAFPISGPNGEATVYAVATKSAGKWTYSTLEVEIKKTGQRIKLLKKSV